MDPAAARKLEAFNERRIIRALEFFESSGERLSDSWNWEAPREPRRDVALFGLGWEREALYARANERVLRMVEQGLFQEWESLLRREAPPWRSSYSTLSPSPARRAVV